MLLTTCLVFCFVAASSALECARCGNVTNSQNCQHLVTCNNGDHCYTSSHGAGMDMTFDLGCKTESECLEAASASLVGRSLGQQQCSKCCAEDHCNHKLCSSVGSQGSHTVAFTVAYPNSSLIGGRPIFTRIITNVGGGYDPSTAKFTCPVSGLYEFTFNIRPQGKYTISSWIYKNGVPFIYAQNSGYINLATATTSTSIDLTVGDVVNLGSSTGWNHVFQSNDVSFSGALKEG